MRAFVVILGMGALAAPALAGAEEVVFKPLVDARLRYENVAQDGPAPILSDRDADAVTLRARVGSELTLGRVSVLGEAEGTLAIGRAYNAFPFAVSAGQRRPDYPVVADPENIELNRIQIQYKAPGLTATLGRQRLNLDDQRFVGAVGWRQNEQTFDAARIEAMIGPVMLDGIYALSQRTQYGIEARARQAYGGDFIMLGAAVKQGFLTAKLFAYLLDYDEGIVFANSSQTYGGRVTGALPIADGVQWSFTGSYARQSDYGLNPNRYAADYALLESSFDVAHWRATLGYELLGSDGAANFAFQTPMATLHRFNGWADKFLTTPGTGLRDLYAGVGYTVPHLGSFGPLVAGFTFHRFASDRNAIHYGDEYDGSLSLKLNRQLSALLKYAAYRRNGIASFAGDADTDKFWAEIDYAL